MSSKLTTRYQRYTTAKQFINTIAANSSYYYLFVGNHDPLVTAPPAANTDETSATIDVYKNMIAGKLITHNDVVPAIKHVSYALNTLYDMYDDADPLLETKDFFVVTDEGSFKHVYKCLDNNRSALSSVQPNFAHITGSNSTTYQTSDGYRWKYMYSVSSAQSLKFATSDYFPVFANSIVANNARGGAIDVIVVEGVGQKYDNYVSGTLSTAHIRVNGNNILYEIANSTASLIPNFYTGCLMYISTGTGAGGHSRINSYISNNDGTFVVLANSFATSPTNSSEYEIFPEVLVFGSGVKLVNCVARALVNSLASNSVYRVEMLDRGSGYDFAYSANVVAHDSVNITLPAELRPINSPPRGHGFEAAEGLFCNSVLISVKISNTENSTIPATNSFKQIGILRDPLFANVSVELTSDVGTFSVAETVYCVNTVQLAADVTISVTSNVVTSATGDFINQIGNDPYVLIKSSANDSYQLGIIGAIASASSLTLTTNGTFACTAAVIYKANTCANAIVSSANNTNVLLANVAGQFGTNSQLIGATSGAYTLVNSISISSVTKGFGTFVEAYKYTGTVTSGTLVQNEHLIQANAVTGINASALIHSTSASGGIVTVYTTQQIDNFSIGGTNTVVGSVSGAELQLLSAAPPELVFRTGEILYYENVAEIARSAVTSEIFQTTLAF